jgi:sugar phosphate isomerase/epimerase
MRLSIQLYTVRDQLANDLEGTLQALKDMGLEYVELAGDYGLSAAEWATMLTKIGLKVSGNHVGVDQVKGDTDKVIADAKAVGNPNIIIPWVGDEIRSMGWAEFGRSLIPFAAKVKEAGLTLSYHNHDFEFVTEDGKPGLENFYAAAPEVSAELDLAWVKIGGGDPVSWVEAMAGRVPCVHVKDFDPTKSPQWRPAGQGIQDFDAILAACEKAGVDFACVELDESPGSPLEAVRESVEYFHGKGLK